MPGLSHLLDDVDGDSSLDACPELFKLMLPSQLSPNDRESWCLPGLPTLEARFRYAQADDALAEIRRLRRLFQGLSDQNRKHITSSQHTGTRATAAFERYKVRILRFAALYRNARRALIALDPEGKATQWAPRFLELKDTDIRGPGRDEDEPSEGRTVSSWIWLVPKPSSPPNTSHPNTDSNTSHPNADSNASHPNANPDDSDDSDESNLSGRAASGDEIAVSLRAHWARCQARAERYEEEVKLTTEEMRRTLEFFKWKSSWWLSLQDARMDSATPPDPQIQHGLRAYARRQASIYSSLVDTYVDHWRKFLVEHSLGTEWLKLYPVVSPPAAKSIPTEGLDKPLDDGDEDEADSEDPIDPEFEERFGDPLDN